MDDKFEAFEEDFEIDPPVYQVWLLGYDDKECITDFDELVATFYDPDQAIKFAREYAAEEKYKKDYDLTSDNLKYLEVLVETVVVMDNESGYEENVETLYTAHITLE